MSLLTTKEIQELIEKLQEEILHHQDLYYNQNKSEISDEEFDKKFQKLQDLESQYPEFKTKNSPTQKVGSDSNKNFEKLEHKIPMLSLENTYNYENLSEWIVKTGLDELYSIQWKIDGSSIAIYYEQGILKKALTRGDGIRGDVVTENIKTIETLPHQLSQKLDVILKGEVFISYDDFEKLNLATENKFANPRNLAAGTLKHKNPKEVAKRPLRVFLYDAIFTDVPFFSYQEVYKKMEELDICFIPNTFFVSGRRVIEEIKEFEQKRKSTNFPNDGLVISVCDLALRKRMGYTARVPRWARAFKFESEKAITQIIDISLGVGRTGKITPKAHLKPVFLAGTTVSFATLHNQNFITENKIGIGAEVEISKRGEIIPAVESVIKAADNIFQIPNLCPSCQHSIVKLDEVVDYFCVNDLCEERKINLLIYFCSKGQMNIEGLGKKQVELLYHKKLIQNLTDIYTLYKHKQSLISEKNFGEKRVLSILEGIEKSKNQSFEVVLASFGFPEITKNTVKILKKHSYRSIQKIFQLVNSSDAIEVLKSMNGIGNSTAKSIISTFQDSKNIQLLNSMQEIGLKLEDTAWKESSERLYFQDQTWVVTGTFINFQPRQKIVDIIEKFGGTVSKTISTKVDYLIAGLKAGSKLQKAKELNIKTLEEKDFLDILKNFNIEY